MCHPCEAEADSASESEPEEPEEFKKLTAGRSPTPAQREQHELENHAVYRDWCSICVGSRGLGTPHRRKKKEQKKEEQEGPRIYSDFYFMSTEEESMPMLAVKFSRSGRLGATAVERKGVTEFGVKYFGSFIKQTAVRRFINHSDNEPAMVALKDAAARSLPGVEAVPRNSPVGDHQANGSIESGVREIKRQMRAVRMALERRLGRKLDSRDPILTWVPTFSADAIARHRKGKDGKTPYERETGRKWAKGGLEFGEKVYIKEAKERAGRPKMDWEPRMVPVRYVGHHARTGAVVGLSADGVKVGQVAKRLPTSERWSFDGWEDIKGLPWDTNPDRREAPAELGEPGVALPAGAPAAAEDRPFEKRNFYVKKTDVAKYGTTVGCPGCAHVRSGGQGARTHSKECRQRIMEKIETDDAERINAFREKMFGDAAQEPAVTAGSEAEQGDSACAAPAATAGAGAHPSEAPAPEATGATQRAAVQHRADVPRKLAVKRDGAEEPDGPSRGAKFGRTDERHGVQASSSKSNVDLTTSSSKKRASEAPIEQIDPSVPGEGEQQGAILAQSASSSSAGPVVIPPDVQRSAAMDIEDMVAGPGEVVRPGGGASSSSGHAGSLDVSMSEGKAALVELASLQVESAYRRHGVDITPEELAAVAALQVELGAAQVLEIFSPKRFTKAGARLGLRPGFAVDLCERKPYGPNEGEFWDLEKDEDVKELEEMIVYEQPELLTGGPPCEPFSQLLRISAARADPERRRRARETGVRHLHTAIGFYRRQYDAGRYFLHEHPDGADSWADEKMVELQRLDGVFTVNGPMCRWGMQFHVDGRDESYVFKKTRWVTNSRTIAEALDQWCVNHTGGPPHRHLHLIGGIARQAAAYPPRLVHAVLEALKQQMLEDGSISELELKVAGPVPTLPTFDGFDRSALHQLGLFYDNITGEELEPEAVMQARAVEIDWVRSINLYDKVPRAEALSRGHKPLPVRWVDVDKGDYLKPNIRSRLVGKELKAKTKDALLAHELFSATPPWEAVKSLLSLMVTDGVAKDGEELELGVFDISRAHFMPAVKRELYIEVPEEDRLPGEGDVVGRLNRNMYGFRDASNGWMEDWQKNLGQAGYVVGTANPALFFNAARNSRGAVHGDDFYVLGNRSALDHINGVLGSKYSLRESHRLGFGSHCSQAATVLNRVVTLGRGEDGRKYVQLEVDTRHVDLIVRSLGLDEGKSRPAATPRVKRSEEQEERRRGEPLLSKAEASLYRSNVMRASFIAQDRADLCEAVKVLARSMSKPTRSSMDELKHLARYLLGKPSVALRFEQQRMPTHILISVDSDHAADRETRRSTTGMAMRLGRHTVKATSNLQSAISLNVSEAEFYALTHGAANGLGLQAYLRDLGFDFPLVVESDSTSAGAFASRRGLGKQRHVQTRFLWVQDLVAKGDFKIRKVATAKNVSDILTKATAGPLLERHLATMGFVTVSRSVLQKRV